MSGFWSNLFGAFTKVEKEGNSFFYLMSGTETDLPYKSLFEIYKNIPHLRSVINKKAELFSTANFKIVSTGGSEDEINTGHPLNAVLQNPNSMQSWRQMLFMISVYKSIAGVAFIYPGFGFTRTAKRLSFIKNIDFNDYTFNLNSNVNTIAEEDVDKIVKNVKFTMDNGVQNEYLMSDLIMFKDCFDSYLKNFSRITTLKEPINIIYKALIARGILIDKKGGVGILSGNQKDGGVAVPMKPEERKKLDQRLNNYGLGRGKEPVILTDVPMKWQSMVFPTNQLMLLEETEDAFFIICDEYGVSRETFSGNATFANKEQADQMTYNNVILSEWSDFFSLMNKELNTAAERIRIDVDYSHIAALAGNEKEEVDTQVAKSSMLLNELDRGVITALEYRQQMGYGKG
jgi:hypothetical protein